MDERELRLFMDRAEWMADANCRGVEARLFFPERDEDAGRVKAICRECDVQAECLAFALNSGEHFGIWGGLSERERRRLRRPAVRVMVASGPMLRLPAKEDVA